MNIGDVVIVDVGFGTTYEVKIEDVQSDYFRGKYRYFHTDKKGWGEEMGPGRFDYHELTHLTTLNIEDPT